jgi:hypothetical protein
MHCQKTISNYISNFFSSQLVTKYSLNGNPRLAAVLSTPCDRGVDFPPPLRPPQLVGQSPFQPAGTS